MGRSGRISVTRLMKGTILENAKRIGFRPGTIIDVGFAFGTDGLFDIFDDVSHVLIDPIAETEQAMELFCKEHPNSVYYVAAASDTSGSRPIVARSGVTGSSFHTKLKTKDGQLREVPTVTLDQIAEAHSLPKPYLVKLDVEGHELNVLRGAEQCLLNTEMIIVEVSTWTDDHPLGRPSLIDLFLFLSERGFVFYEFAEPGYRPIDGALYMFDAVFVAANSGLRQVRANKTPEQAAISREVKAAHVRAMLEGGGD